MTSLRVGASSSASSVGALRPRRRCLDHVGDVVGLEQAHPLAALAGAEVEQQRGLVARRQRDEELLGVLARQHAEAVAALLEIEQRPGVAQLVDASRSSSSSSSAAATVGCGPVGGISSSSTTSESSPRLSATALISSMTSLGFLGRQRSLGRTRLDLVVYRLGYLIVGRGHRGHPA